MASPVQLSSSTVDEAPPADLSSNPSTANPLDDLLSYPAPPSAVTIPVASSSSSSSAQPRVVLKHRLYVGNLHPTVDEYALLQLFSRFGKIAKLDFLFHKSGPLKGKPRGYAFVEFADQGDAERALLHANEKLLRGRKLMVTYANQAPFEAGGSQGLGLKNRRPVSDVGKPTTLSLLKSAGAGRSNATDAKIARMEAKLRQLESAAEGSGATGPSSLPTHPSLPPKPVGAPVIPERRHTPTDTVAPTPMSSRDKARAPPLPILPLKPPAHLPQKPTVTPPVRLASTPSPPRVAPARKAALSGVRIVKHKPNTSSGS